MNTVRFPAPPPEIMPLIEQGDKALAAKEPNPGLAISCYADAILRKDPESAVVDGYTLSKHGSGLVVASVAEVTHPDMIGYQLQRVRVEDIAPVSPDTAVTTTAKEPIVRRIGLRYSMGSLTFLLNQNGGGTVHYDGYMRYYGKEHAKLNNIAGNMGRAARYGEVIAPEKRGKHTRREIGMSLTYGTLSTMLRISEEQENLRRL